MKVVSNGVPSNQLSLKGQLILSKDLKHRHLCCNGVNNFDTDSVDPSAGYNTATKHVEKGLYKSICRIWFTAYICIRAVPMMPRYIERVPYFSYSTKT